MTSSPDSARVLLVSANREDINMPSWPLGLACVAAATRKAGHEVKLVDLMLRADPFQELEAAIRSFDPEVIGVSVRNIDDQSMKDTREFLDQVREVIARCRRVSIAPIILGGAGYSIYPQSALTYLGGDMGIQGEGEAVFPQLVTRIKAGVDPAGPYGLYRPGSQYRGQRTFVENLDECPLPEVELIAPAAYGGEDFWMPVQTRRGCPMDCSYCSTPAIEGRLLRKRSPQAVVTWLGRCVTAGIHRFYFVDNTFNLPRSYAMELCSAIARAGLRINWRAILYPWNIDERLVERMTRAGCVEVSLGFESGSERILRLMNKRFSPDDVRKAASALGKCGVRRMGFLMMGGPGETPETAEESLAFADSLNLEAMKITVGTRIYPNTPLARKAVEDGIITADDDLLFPRFYMTSGLEQSLREMVDRWMSTRPHWMT